MNTAFSITETRPFAVLCNFIELQTYFDKTDVSSGWHRSNIIEIIVIDLKEDDTLFFTLSSTGAAVGPSPRGNQGPDSI